MIYFCLYQLDFFTLKSWFTEHFERSLKFCRVKIFTFSIIIFFVVKETTLLTPYLVAPWKKGSQGTNFGEFFPRYSQNSILSEKFNSWMNKNQSFFSQKLVHSFSILKKGKGDLHLPPHSSYTTYKEHKVKSVNSYFNGKQNL